MIAKTQNLQRPFQLRNQIMTYAWGSHTAIAALLGQPSPSATAQAEIWMGAHPKAPSEIFFDRRWQPLDRLIERFGDAILGASAAGRFGPRLPYLLKVLAAVEPLSIQAHPDLQQAREGFGRENRAGIPIDAPKRNYRDDNHKPELICALSPFWALNGFRSPDRIRADLQGLCPETLVDELRLPQKCDSPGAIRLLFSRLMTLNDERRGAVIDEAVTRARRREGQGDVWRWVAALSRRYPDDIGVLAPALLNLVCLQAGEAMFLPSGRLHAYLEGTGIEIMANSDNVLRGGLTAKHVDVPELLRVLRFEPYRPEVLTAGDCPAGRFGTAAAEFELWMVQVAAGRNWQSPAQRGVEILLCTDGGGHVTVENGATAGFRKGTSLLVPAAAGAYRIQGRAVLYRAALPQGGQ